MDPAWCLQKCKNTCLNEMGIGKRLIAKSDWEAERQNCSLLKALRVPVLRRDWRLELNKCLLAYHFTPHITTGQSPAELLFGRKLSTKFPEVADQEESAGQRL